MKKIDKKNNAEELIFANNERAFQKQEIEDKASELILTYKEIAYLIEERGKRAAELVIANIELVFQNEEKGRRAAELIIANKELAFENKEKEQRAVELSIANIDLTFQNQEKEQRAAELIIANKELAFQNHEKEKRASELIKAEMEVRKLNESLEQKVSKRTSQYSFISQVNQAIIHCKDEETLFTKVCNIAFSLEFNKYKMAWISKINPVLRVITLISNQGVPQEDIQLLTDRSYEIDSPEDIVLRTSNYFLCNDVENDLRLASCQHFFTKHGIRSCIVLPITKSGSIVGTFNLYATELNYFDKGDVAVLIEVAGDISFALDIFENAKLHHEAEERILKNEKRFRTLIENSADMITLSTKAGKMLYGSPSITKLFGYSTEEIPNTSAFDFIHPDDLSEFSDKRNTLLQTPGKSFYNEIRLKHKNGKWIWCEATLTNMLDEPGINAMVSNFRDISEKKSMQKQQEFDQTNLNALINNTNDLMWSVDTNFKLITSNKPFDVIMKLIFQKEISKGSNVLGVSTSSEQSKRYKMYYERAFDGDVFTELEYNDVPVEFWSEISFFPIRKGNEVIGTACHSRDITKIKKAEQQLSKSEAFNRGVLNSLSSHIAVIDGTGNIVAVNESWKVFAKENGDTTLQHTAEGTNYFSVCKKASEAGDEIARKVLLGLKLIMDEKEKSFYIEYPCHSPHKERWFGMRAMKFESDVSMVVISHMDISERKIAEETLQLTQFAIDNAGDAVIWTKPDSCIFNVNQAAYKMLGYTKEDLLKLSVTDIDPHYNSDKWNIHFAQLQQKKSLVFEAIQKAKDGRLIPVEIRANYIKYGNVELSCSFMRDISERKKGEQKLNDLTDRLLLATDSAQMGIWDWDIKRDVLIWEDNMYNIFDVPRDKFKGAFEAWKIIVHPDDLQGALSDVQEALDGTKDFYSLFRIQRRNKEIRYIEGHAIILRDADGKANRMTGVNRDITEQKIAEKTKEKITADIVQRNNDLEQFSYIVSHNLRAPVANIIGLTELMNENDHGREEHKQMTSDLLSSVQKLDNVIKDLNYILQIKREVTEKKETVKFSALVDDIKQSINNMIKKEHVEIKTDFSRVDNIFTLKSYLYSILYNLISNSIKYCQPGIIPIIEIKSFKVKNKITLLFKDNGLGIDLKKRGEQVFGLYKRFHTHADGKGMGLYMVKTQVETLGGKISIQSTVNKGTEFKIEF